MVSWKFSLKPIQSPSNIYIYIYTYICIRHGALNATQLVDWFKQHHPPAEASSSDSKLWLCSHAFLSCHWSWHGRSIYMSQALYIHRTSMHSSKIIVHTWHISRKTPICIPTILHVQILLLYLEWAKVQQLSDQMEDVVRRQVLNRSHLLPTSSNTTWKAAP